MLVVYFGLLLDAHDISAYIPLTIVARGLGNESLFWMALRKVRNWRIFFTEKRGEVIRV